MENCKLLTINDHSDRRGKLFVVQTGLNLPFTVKRVFFMLDTVEARGGHANKNSTFAFIVMKGTMCVETDNGYKKDIYRLNAGNNQILLIPKMIWKEMYDFSQDCILMVLSDTEYDATEYVRDYQDFLRLRGDNQ